jgi:hypothetical protein
MEHLGLGVYLTACATFLYLLLRPTRTTVPLMVKDEGRTSTLRGKVKR